MTREHQISGSVLPSGLRQKPALDISGVGTLYMFTSSSLSEGHTERQVMWSPFPRLSLALQFCSMGSIQLATKSQREVAYTVNRAYTPPAILRAPSLLPCATTARSIKPPQSALQPQYRLTYPIHLLLCNTVSLRSPQADKGNSCISKAKTHSAKNP